MSRIEVQSIYLVVAASPSIRERRLCLDYKLDTSSVIRQSLMVFPSYQDSSKNRPVIVMYQPHLYLLSFYTRRNEIVGEPDKYIMLSASIN